jgi:hypothetical protein
MAGAEPLRNYGRNLIQAQLNEPLESPDGELQLLEPDMCPVDVQRKQKECLAKLDKSAHGEWEKLILTAEIATFCESGIVEDRMAVPAEAIAANEDASYCFPG